MSVSFPDRDLLPGMWYDPRCNLSSFFPLLLSLVLILPLVALVFLMRKRMPRKAFHILVATILALFVIVFLVRMFDPNNDVVTFQLHQGFVVRAIKCIIY